MTRPLGKKQKEALEAYFSRPLIRRDQPLIQECLAQVMFRSREIEPDLREMVLQGLAGAETVHQAHRMFEDSALSDIGAALLVERDDGLQRLLEALTTGQTTIAARAAFDLHGLGCKAEGLAFLSESAVAAVRDSQSRSDGGKNSEKVQQQRNKIRHREEILSDLLPNALAAAGEKRSSNASHLAGWMLRHWPKGGPSSQELEAGERTVRDWVKTQIRAQSD